MSLLVFDIGGSSLRAGLWCSETKALLRRGSERSLGLDQQPGGDRVAQLIEQLVRLAREVSEGEPDATAIGVAFPGPVDAAGRVAEAPTLFGVREGGPIELQALVERAFGGRPTHVINDLTAAGSRFAEPGEDFCLVTVSSGIGNKVFLDGRPVLGEAQRGGELGHWRVDLREDAPLCECGGRGHLGALASGRSTPQHFRELAQARPELLASSSHAELGADAPDLNERLARAYRGGEPFATELVRRCAHPLGHALANLHLAIGVERFLVMGGWAQALGDGYLRELERSAAESTWGDPSLWTGRVQAVPADDDSGLIGMARYLEAQR